MTINELQQEINLLPTEQRMLIAEYILQSLNPADSDIKAAWEEEVDRRMKAVNKGQCRVIPNEEFHNEWYTLIDEGKEQS